MKHIGRKGFTLIEVLMVVVIVAIMGAIAMPHARGTIDAFNLNGAARVVWSDLHNARMTAIRTNQSVTVTFTDNAIYTARHADNSILFERDFKDDYRGITVRMGGISDFVRFSSTGMATHRTIWIEGPTDERRITVARTGRVSGWLD